MSATSNKTVRCAPAEARALFDAFPAKAKRSLPGHALATIIGLLAADGTTELSQALSMLFPDEPLDKARRRLTTEIANRVYVNEAGNTPLKIVQTRKGIEPALLWLERLDFADARGLTEAGERYAPDQFVPAEATQKASAEIVAEIAVKDHAPTGAPPHVAEATQDHGSEAYTTARNHTIANLVKPHNAANDSLRGSNMSATEFTDTDAMQAEGFLAFPESPHAAPQNTVNALDAMLAWAADSHPTAPKLLALLGDYGTGKTSHALQFSRVLNGDVAHPKRPDVSSSALHIDLAYLRGAPSLAQLNVTQIIRLVIEARGLNHVLSAEDVVREVREGRRILVYDGLDELMQTDHAQLHSVFRQLLQVLEPVPVTRDTSRARLIVSCRTHYFRDLTEQHEFFNTRLRHCVSRKDYLCLYLLPWKPATVRDYLNRRLSADEASALSDTIANTYNLEELASRPVLLAMMCEQVGEVLRLRDAGGGAITASTLYAQTVAMWVRRDDEKHVLQATHKTVLMGALACAMWNGGKEFWEADRLDRWLRKTVDVLFPGHYSPEQTQAIQDDLRTATFIVRPGQDGFTFAHRSFMEFFIARHLVTLMDLEELPAAALRPMLPTRQLNRECLAFFSELVSTRSDLRETRAARLWSWLSFEHGQSAMDTHVELPSAAPASHAVLFKLACKLKLNAPNSAMRANLRCAKLELLDVAGMKFPSLDVRWTDLTSSRFVSCSFPSIWAARANLNHVTFRDCAIADLHDMYAETEQRLFRQRVSARAAGLALTGPWTSPPPEIDLTTSARATRRPSCRLNLVHADDDIIVLAASDGGVYCWDTTCGKLRWGSRSSNRYAWRDCEWFLDAANARVVCLRTGMFEEFRLSDGKRTEVTDRSEIRACHKSGRAQRRAKLTGQWHVGRDVQKHLFLSGPLAGCTRYFVHADRPSTACFDAEGRLVDYDEEAADTWLRYLGNGYPQPVEAAWLELDEMGRTLGPKKVVAK